MLTLPLLAFGLALSSGPVTTVPWNGHTGAASFTYDDARKGQIPNLIPQLDALSIKATFFLTYGAGGDLSTNKAAWIKASTNGHELANHTYDHQNVAAGTTQIKKMADDLRGFDAGVDAATFAYPNCNVGAPTEVDAQAFMGRGCGSTTYAWGTQPSDWKNIQGLILTSGAPGPGVNLINGAKSSNGWAITIVHDVTASPDQYSLTPADNKKLLDAAVAANVWIAPYGTVGAYYRAHFTMDAATATRNGTGWDVKWTSPHPRMPRSVRLLVKLASSTFGTDFVVKQGGAAIAPQPDGSYAIEFMKLAMTVEPRTVGVQPRTGADLRDFEARWTENGIALDGIGRGAEVVVADVRGGVLFRGPVEGKLLALSRPMPKGLLFVTLVDRASGSTVRRMVNAVR